MGQMVAGILLGIMPTSKMLDAWTNGDETGPFDKWRNQKISNVPDDYMARRLARIEWTDDGLVGYWIALGPDGCDTRPLDRWVNHPNYQSTFKRWEKFVEFMQRNDIFLPTHRLWFAYGEIA